MSLINPLTVMAALALIFTIIGLVRPQALRMISGIFFLLMAWGVNFTMLLSDPSQFVAAGANALLPIYRWFFSEVLTLNPVLFICALIAFETSVGLLILSKGKYTRLGLIGAVVFCLGITFIGPEEATCPLLAIPFSLLVNRNFEYSLPEMVMGMFHRPQADAA